MDAKPVLNNFIPINRKLFKHALWAEKRAFSHFEAWLDLLVTARYDNSEASILIKSQLITWHRGEVVASLRYLGQRWGWGKTKVNNYIKMLSIEKMIKTRTPIGTAQTVITICNYDTYNSFSKNSGQFCGQAQDSDETAARQRQDKTNKENIEQKSKEREIYRGFAHLVIFTDEFLKLTALGFDKTRIDAALDAVENYKKNSKYKSLYLTAKNWLQKQDAAAPAIMHAAPKSGKVNQIANAFKQALQHE